jgi:hypothetical protein
MSPQEGVERTQDVILSGAVNACHSECSEESPQLSFLSRRVFTSRR